MPIFEYKCQDCGAQFEELVAGRDDCPPCPECGSAKTGKLMSACCVRAGGALPDVDGPVGPSTTSSGGCSGCSGGDCSSCG